jgi:hypothetical protein
MMDEISSMCVSGISKLLIINHIAGGTRFNKYIRATSPAESRMTFHPLLSLVNLIYQLSIGTIRLSSSLELKKDGE